MAQVYKFPAMPKKIIFDAPHRLREIREAAKLSLRALVEKLDGTMTVNQISRIERGAQQLTQHNLEVLARALGVVPADILPITQGGLTKGERELIETYRQIPSHMRAGFDAMREAHQPFRGESEVIDLDKAKTRSG